VAVIFYCWEVDDVFSEKLQAFGKILEKPREYTIQPPK
jgi:hypothetical protein